MSRVNMKELEQIDLPTFQHNKEIKVKHNTDKRRAFYGKGTKTYAIK